MTSKLIKSLLLAATALGSASAAYAQDVTLTIES